MSSYSEYLSRQQQRLQKFVDTRPHRDAGHQTEIVKRRAAAAVLESTNPRSAGVLVLDGPSTQVRSFYAKAHNVQDASVFAGFEAAQAVAQSEIPRNAKASQISQVCYSSSVVPEYNDRLRTDTQLGLVQAEKNRYQRGWDTAGCCQVYGNPPRLVPIVPTDAIAASLTTSLASYNAASTGDWVKITSTEYTTLKTNVTGTQVAGTTDALYPTMSTASPFGANARPVVNKQSASTPVVAPNSYLYAFAFFFNNTVATPHDTRPLLGTSPNTSLNMVPVGSVIATSSITNGDNYFVLKGASTTTGASGGDLGIHSVRGSGFVGSGTPGRDVFYSDIGTFPLPSPLDRTLTDYAVRYQGLTTTTKQW